MTKRTRATPSLTRADQAMGEVTNKSTDYGMPMAEISSILSRKDCNERIADASGTEERWDIRVRALHIPTLPS